jgi:hypothetical protein
VNEKTQLKTSPKFTLSTGRQIIGFEHKIGKSAKEAEAKTKR